MLLVISQWASAGQLPDFAKPLSVTHRDVIVQKKAGVMWQKTPAEIKYTHGIALKYCKNLTLGGYSDWRLPKTDLVKKIFKNPDSLKALKDPGEYWCSDIQESPMDGAVVLRYYWVNFSAKRIGYDELGLYAGINKARLTRCVRPINK